MVHACIMGTCSVVKRPTVHVTRGGRGACINGTAYILELRESRRERGGNSLTKSVRSKEENSAVFLVALLGAVFLFLHSRYSLLLL